MLNRQKGDTIIEVLLAVTIFSLVSVMTITIMNQGNATAQRALEITLVRQQIDGQVEALRAAHQAYSANNESETWQTIVAQAGSNPASIDTANGCPQEASFSNGIFTLDPLRAVMLQPANMRSINDSAAPLFPQVVGTTSYGLWIEPREREATSPGIRPAYDFRIRACWSPSGNDGAPMELETDVRLYGVAS